MYTVNIEHKTATFKQRNQMVTGLQCKFILSLLCFLSNKQSFTTNKYANIAIDILKVGYQEITSYR